MRTRGFVVLAALAVLGLSACSPQPTTRPTPSTTAGAEAVALGDGVLTVATVFDSPADAAAAAAGVELAAREIDETGGVLGAHVVVLHRSVQTATDLADRHVDVVLWGSAAEPPADPAAAVVRLAAPADAAALALPSDDVQARLRQADPGLTDLHGGAEAYDTLVSVALAAQLAGNDAGPAVAAALPLVASGGVSCTSWGACAAAVADRQSIRFTGVGAEQAPPTAEPRAA